jgi:Protein of unknown function (DUF2281)
MSANIEANIVEQLHRLDDHRQAEVLDFVEFLASKSKAAPQNRSPEFDPMRYSGTVQWPVDGLAYQEAIRKEWE